MTKQTQGESPNEVLLLRKHKGNSPPEAILFKLQLSAKEIKWKLSAGGENQNLDFTKETQRKSSAGGDFFKLRLAAKEINWELSAGGENQNLDFY